MRAISQYWDATFFNHAFERQMSSRDIVRPAVNTSEDTSFAFDCVYSYQTFMNSLSCTFKGPRVNRARGFGRGIICSD